MKAVFALLLVVAANAVWVQLEPDLLPENARRGWTQVGVPEPDSTHAVLISLTHDAAKMAELDRIFWEVSDPKHANYGKYLSNEQVADILSAPQANIDNVLKYLASYGVVGTLGVNRDTIWVEASVSTIEKMLNTKLAIFEREVKPARVTRASQAYYLPHEVYPAVAVVAHLLDFPNWNGPRIVDPAVETAAPTWPNTCPASCAGRQNPQSIAGQYMLTQSLPINAKSSMGVAEFQGQYYDSTDLSSFTSGCGISPITVVDKNGGNQPALCSAGACVEALLDLEYLHAVASPSGNLPMADYYYTQYSILTYMTQLNGDPARPYVNSVSYGNDEVQQTSTSYMFQVNTQFQTAGTLGVSMMIASGDQGVWGRTGCCTEFHPDFPASSPYVTAVGGTDYMNTSPSIGSQEQCCQDGGGGFSNTFNMPAYQTAAVNGYLTSGVALPASHYYNASGRAYPDVSANFGLIVSYCMFEADRWVGVAGTSASSPVFTSLIANLNNVQFNNGKAALGFLNPLLYSMPYNSFTDITVGQNNGGFLMGFNAAPGWDPCSGLGTGKYTTMMTNLP